MRRNYNVYLSQMEKGNSEKLFFLNQLNINKFKTIIDFGCGRGDVLKECGKVNLHCKLVAIDSDEYMLQLVNKNLNNYSDRLILCSQLTKGLLDEDTLIIFNSVLHEVEDYSKELIKILQGTKCTIAIRDMKYSSDGSIFMTDQDFSKLIKAADIKRLSEFIDIYGYNLKQMVHFLLKFTYIDNWPLELRENYFSFDYDLFNSLLGFKLIYKKDYLLKFKDNQIKENFNINLNDYNIKTHTKRIYIAE